MIRDPLLVDHRNVVVMINWFCFKKKGLLYDILQRRVEIQCHLQAGGGGGGPR